MIADDIVMYPLSAIAEDTVTQDDPLRRAIQTGGMFSHSLDAVPLDWQTRTDMQDLIGMVIEQLREGMRK